MALLELFSRSAPAGLIAAGKLARRGLGGGSSVSACASGRAASGRLGRLRLLFLFGLFSGSNRHSENRLGGTARDTRLHLLEEAVCLALVGNERVLLPIAAEVDALAELFHRREVLDPVCVDRAEEDPALDGTGQLVTELLLARLVRLLDDLGDAIAQLVLVAELAEARGHDVRAVEHRPER